MVIITVNTPFNIDLEFKVADFSSRFFAWLIDIAIICVYYYLMLSFAYPVLKFDGGISSLTGMVAIVIPVIVYQLAFEIFMNGQTPGKKLMGIKIIDIEGKEPTWGQFITRWMLCLGNFFLYILPQYIILYPAILLVFGIVYLPDVITMLVSGKSQRIGDLAAGTVVIDARYKPNINETIYQQIDVVQYQPKFPQVMRLTDRDINGIRNLLDIKRPGKDTEIYVAQVVNKIKKVLNIETESDGYDFLQQLLFDYNYIAGNGV